MIGLDVMILGIVVPLGFNAISGSLREYGEYGHKLYTNDWRIKYLIKVVLAHLVVCIIYNAFHSNSGKSALEGYLVFITVLSIGVGYIALSAGRITFRYGHDRLFVLSQIKQRLMLAYKTNSIDEYYATIEGYGVFLVAMLERGESSLVEQGLSDFEAEYLNICNLWDTDAKRANLFFYEANLLDGTEAEKVDEMLYYNQDSLLALKIVSQIKVIYDSTAKLNQYELNYLSQLAIVRILEATVPLRDLSLIISNILGIIRDISFTTIDRDDKAQYVALHWFNRCAFQSRPEKRMRLEYYDQLISTLFRIMKYSVSKEYSSLMKSFQSHIHDGLGYFEHKGPRYVVSEIHDEEFNAVVERFAKIYEDEVTAITPLKFKATKNRLDKSLKSLKSIMTEVEKSEDDQIIRAYRNHHLALIASAEDRYKYDQLKTMVGYLLAYCLFHERKQWVIDFWQYPQPDDASADWIGVKLFEDDIYQFYQYHFDDRGYRHSDFEFHEDRHGTEQYLDYYLAMRTMYNYRLKDDAEIQYDDLPFTNVDLLFGLESSLRNMERFIIVEGQSTEDYGVFRNKARAVEIATSLISFLSEQIDVSKSKYIEHQTIILSKIEELKSELDKALASRRKLSKVLEMIADEQVLSDHEGEKRIVRFTADKAQFIEWRVAYSGFGDAIGGALAEHEDIYIYSAIMRAIQNHSSCNAAEVIHEIIRVTSSAPSIDLIISNHYIDYSTIRSQNAPIITEFQHKSDQNIYSWWLQLESREIPILYVPYQQSVPQVFLVSVAEMLKELRKPDEVLAESEIYTTADHYKISTEGEIESSGTLDESEEIQDETKVLIVSSIRPYVSIESSVTAHKILIQ